MTTNDRIIQVVFDAIDEVNQFLPEEQQLAISLDTYIFGQSGGLDSLGLINLVVAIEQKIQEEFELTIALANEKAMAQKNSPFESISSLVDYILLLLKEAQNG